MEFEVLLFEVDDKRFGVRSEVVKEVVRAVKLSPLPQRSATVEGLLNLRGRVVPVLDIRALFGMATREIRYTDHLIVVEAGGHSLTLRVDRATDLVGASDLKGGRTGSQDSQLVDFVGKVGDDIVHVLDVNQLIALEDAAAAVASTESTNTELSP